MEAAEILRAVVAAHGGADYWNGLEALEAEISASGFLFTAKRRPPLKHVRMRADTREPRFTLFDYPHAGQTGELTGAREVCIRNGCGELIARRENPRLAFRGLRHRLRWDDLDFLYFCGYATWSYLTLPFSLMGEGFVIRKLEAPSGQKGDFPARLAVAYPQDIPAHSREQILYFDERRLMCRLDYTAEVVGSWAHAAHFCDTYRTFGNLRVPTLRRVVPILFGRPMPGPTLVAIEVHWVEPLPA